jgi:pentatricopeptide repeat protein
MIYSFVQALNAHASLQGLEEGRHIHRLIMQSGCESNVYVCSTLVDMYANCGSIEDAWKVFNQTSTPNAVSWSTIILGHVKCGQGQKAMQLYQPCIHNWWWQTVQTCIKHVHCWWQVGSEGKCEALRGWKRDVKKQLDAPGLTWIVRSTWICSGWTRTFSNAWNLCRAT